VTKVVWVLPRIAPEPRSGTDLRTHRLIAAMAQEAEVHLVVVGEASAEATRHALGVSSVEVFPRRPALGQGVALIAHQWPFATASSWSAAASRRVRDLSDAGFVVLADHPQMGPYLPVPSRGALLTHNVESPLLSQLPAPPGLPGRLRRSWDIRAMARLEQTAVASAGLVVAVSPADAAALRPDALVVENGADLPLSVPPLPSDGLTLFVGGLTYPPNRAAVGWWLDAARAHGAQAELTVVGTGATDDDRAVGAGHVRYVGEVDSVAAWLTQARVVAVPLQHGGGTRLKVLEALAWGRPVVSTSKGVEGLPVMDGTHALIADGARDFVEAVERVRTDDELAARLGAEGRLLAEQFAWERITPKLVSAVRGLSQRA
jgi:glycosyltransferase involved in cell wall biosynthesis